MSGSLLGVELNDLRSRHRWGICGFMSFLSADLKEFAQAAGVHDGTFEQLYTHFKERTPVDEFVHAKMLDVVLPVSDYRRNAGSG